MEDSIFTKILKHEIPGEVVYEDDTSAVLLTIEPLSAGHMLVIPKLQIDHLWDVDTDLYHHLWDIAKQMSKRLKDIYDYERVGVIVEGYGVPHAHIHVFGITKSLEPLLAETHALKQSGQKGFATPEELKAVADKLRN